MDNKKLILRTPGETNFLARIRQYILEYAEDIGFSNTEMAEIEMAVDETATNIIKHAYDEDPEISKEDRMIEIEAVKLENGLEILIRDRARPFNPKNVPIPSLDEHYAKMQTHGMGVFAMKKFMDEIDHRYIDGIGNEVVLRKFIK